MAEATAFALDSANRQRNHTGATICGLRLPKVHRSRLSGVSLWGFPVLVSSKRQERVRMAAAWFSLLAVALLYAPLAGAAWLAHSMDCCAGGYCPIAAHHHHKQQPAPLQHSSPVDCGHDMSAMGGMMSCSMSCCQDPARPALIPGSFLLPAIISVPSTEEAARLVQITRSLELSRFIKPLSPPPRFSSPAL
jgi:hypothetical protein